MAVSDIVVAAICGNWWIESGIDPGVWESLDVGTWTDLNKGYGLGQWTNTGGDTHGRLYQLHEYLTTNGYAIDDGDGQIAFMLHEQHWAYHSEYGEFHTLDDFLASDSHNVEYLTHAFNLCWEGIHDGTWNTRVTHARTCLSYIREHGEDPNSWITGNRYLSTSERLNNAVLVFQVLEGQRTHGGGGGKMPIYFYLKKHRR